MPALQGGKAVGRRGTDLAPAGIGPVVDTLPLDHVGVARRRTRAGCPGRTVWRGSGATPIWRGEFGRYCCEPQHRRIWSHENQMKRSLISKGLWFAVLVLIVLLAVIGLSVEHWEWLNGPNSATVRNIGLLAVGVIAILLAFWRSNVAERQAETAQAGLLNERYQKGAEMLGSGVLSVRLGGIYALKRLAEEHPKEFHIQIIELFCAFVRHPTEGDSHETVAPERGSGETGERLIPLIPAFLDAVFSVDRCLMFSYCSDMASRWKQDRPMSRAAFEARFPDEAACARHLAAMRWPDGFVCPACGHDRGWELKRRRASWECAACGKETSVSAGTVMHRSHLPLKTWFMAIHIVTSHSNGISALQLQAQLGLGSYKSAWLLLHKLRRAMVAPDRSLLEDLVEIDEATLPLRTKQEPPTGGQGRSPQGKMRIAGAVELSPEGEPRRIRLAPIGDFSACSLHAFVAGTSAPGARVITDGWSGYGGLSDHDHAPKIVGTTSAHLVLRWSHRVFSNLKRWALGTFHGLRRPHLRRYLDEFVFRWNRRRHTATAFDALLGIGTRLQPAGYRDIVEQRA